MGEEAKAIALDHPERAIYDVPKFLMEGSNLREEWLAGRKKYLFDIQWEEGRKPVVRMRLDERVLEKTMWDIYIEQLQWVRKLMERMLGRDCRLSGTEVGDI